MIGFISGMVGTGLGGLFTFFLKKPTKRFMAILLGFTSGIMLSVVCFDLIPESIRLGGVGMSLLGISTGAVLMLVLDDIIQYRRPFRKAAATLNEYGYGFIKSGILLGIGIAIHNFPEGLAVGSGFAASDSLGLGLALVIGLHDMPEGIAMAAPLRMGGVNRFRILLYTILAGIPMGVGAFMGELLGGISQIFICLCLSFAGGAMLYITCGELIPKTNSIYKGRFSTVGMIIGILCGIFVSHTF
jgi:ZIP family zinc transporter